jgi:hypothetical protein
MTTDEPIVLIEDAGAWTNQVSGLGLGTLNALSCAAGTCTAVGEDFATNEPFDVVENSGMWGSASEGDAPGGGGSFNGVSCTSASSCTAVGTDTGTNEPLYDDLSGASNGGPPTSDTATTTTTTTTTTTPVTTTTVTSTPPRAPRRLHVTVAFSLDSARLTRADLLSLDHFVRAAAAERVHSVTITGFSSRVGTVSFNRRLSLERAEVVADYLPTLFRARGDRHVGLSIRNGGIKRLPDARKDQIASVMS